MAGNDQGRIWKHQQALVDRLNQSRAIASGQVGSADRTRKKRVSAQQQGLGWEVKADVSRIISAFSHGCYFLLAGALWVDLMFESTERSAPPVRERTIVRPMEVSINMTAA